MNRKLNYSQQTIEDDDVSEVISVLKSGWLTTGPKVSEFEEVFSEYVGSEECVSLSSGTAALHAVMNAIQLKEGDEVIVPAMTFAATANSVVYQNAKPVFVDVDPETLLIDPNKIEAKITRNTKAVVAVDYAGQPCDYDILREICERNSLLLIADSCHALGAEYKNRKVGSIADLTAFSFHPVKHITTGEGGMVSTDNRIWADRIRKFRNHGINVDCRQRSEQNTWYYEIDDLGFNYRLSDLQCALGISQLKKLPGWLERRWEIADFYHQEFKNIPAVKPLKVHSYVKHAYHLFVIRLKCDEFNITRDEVFKSMKKMGMGVNVHYIPVHFHPFYRKNFNTYPGLCPETEKAYDEILSIPMFPAMSDDDASDVIECLKDSLS